jgi:hypothetical protein
MTITQRSAEAAKKHARQAIASEKEAAFWEIHQQQRAHNAAKTERLRAQRLGTPSAKVSCTTKG